LKRHNIITGIWVVFALITLRYQVNAETVSDSASTWVDEKDSIEVYYYQGDILNLKLNNLTYIDTTITDFHQYDPLYKGNNVYSTLSNIGFIHNNLMFSPFLTPGYSKSLPWYQKYLYTNDKIRYYKLSKPYTELFYTMGPKKEQEFKVVFSRELVKGLSFGMNFYLISSHGNYKRSKSNNNTGYLTLGYITPNKRYVVNINYMFNKLDMQESGGISDDSYFSDNLEPDRSVIPVNLDNANNTVTESGVFVQQYFNLSKPKAKNDSSFYLDMGSISYSFQYKKNHYLFTDHDPLSPFYDTIYAPLDSTNTYDSTGQQFIINTVGWTSAGYEKENNEKPFYIYANLTHENIKQQLPADSLSSTINQMHLWGGIGINIKESFYLKAGGFLYFGGYNSGDFGINGTINQFIGNKKHNYGELLLGVKLINKMPWWFYQNFGSNHFRWNNNFDKETYLILSGQFIYKKINAGVDFTTVGNYTYLNDSIRPAQIESAETILTLYLNGNIPFGKFGIDTRLSYQATSRPGIIRLPAFLGSMNFYFKSPVFKRAATIQMGLQMRYFTSYYANAYMPELRAFYLQNDKLIGNYLWADVYLTLKIQRARLFAKMSNVTGYFEGYNYWAAPHYPDRDARFYFGVSWRFHD